MKSQREAASGESANFPSKFGSQTEIEPVKNIRIKPQGVASANPTAVPTPKKV